MGLSWPSKAAKHKQKTHVFLLKCALLAVVRVRHARAPADDAAPLVGPVVALVAHADEGGRPHIGVADGALAIALLAQAPNSCTAQPCRHSQEYIRGSPARPGPLWHALTDAWLLAAHDQIRMVLHAQTRHAGNGAVQAGNAHTKPHSLPSSSP
jgi:hypothetical protein